MTRFASLRKAQLRSKKQKRLWFVTLALDHFLRVIALPALRNDMTHHGSDDEGTEMINEVSLERFLWSRLFFLTLRDSFFFVAL